MQPRESQQGSIQSPRLKPAAWVETNLQTHGLNNVAGSHFCPLSHLDWEIAYKKPQLAFLQVDIDDRTKCKLLLLSNKTQVFRRVSRLYQLILDLERQEQNPFTCSFSWALLDHVEECPHFWRKLMVWMLSSLLRKFLLPPYLYYLALIRHSSDLFVVYFLPSPLFSNTSIKFSDLYVLQNLVINFWWEQSALLMLSVRYIHE